MPTLKPPDDDDEFFPAKNQFKKEHDSTLMVNKVSMSDIVKSINNLYTNQEVLSKICTEQAKTLAQIQTLQNTLANTVNNIDLASSTFDARINDLYDRATLKPVDQSKLLKNIGGDGKIKKIKKKTKTK